ncbi:hypothetical protein [Amycolatopsis speibonae]|uniref:hypothetical protein n=1 Tax=Amycolatopsis speibonae TaxID=1450224 RepID=UPI00366FF70A
MSVRDSIDRSGMSRFQIRVVAICLVINLVDGFDVLVMPFAAPGWECCSAAAWWEWRSARPWSLRWPTASAGDLSR